MQNAKPLRSMLQLITMMVIVLVSFQASAQSTSQNDGAVSDDPVQIYIAKNPEAPLTRFYNMNPKDMDILKAMKNTIILENPGNYPGYNVDELKLMSQENVALEKLFKQIDELVRQGNSYDRAKTHVLNNQENAKIQPSEAPAFMAAPSK